MHNVFIDDKPRKTVALLITLTSELEVEVSHPDDKLSSEERSLLREEPNVMTRHGLGLKFSQCTGTD